MATVYYDRFGGFQGENPAPNAEKIAYKINKASSSVTYICFTEDDENGGRVIERITTSGNEKTIELAYGSWDDPSSITTWYPPNQAIPVEIED